MRQYRVALAGLGARGKIHARGFLANEDRFQLVGISDLDEAKLTAAAEELGLPCTRYTDTEEMLASTRPDVFCFATLPEIRLPLVELGVKYGVKAIAFEKPMATSLAEAHQIVELCETHGIKATVSHQQKYLSSMQKLKQIVDADDIGDIVDIHATTLPWLSQLGTHFIDYMIWINGGSRARWVVGHVHGKEKLSDTHPSPDYLLGRTQFENGVSGIIECGYLSPVHVEGKNKFWVNNRLTVHGTHGYAWAETDGRWGAFTRRSGPDPIGGQTEIWNKHQHTIQGAYLRELADWLDDDGKVHSCNVRTAYHGYEILEGMCLSALNNTRVDLPLVAGHADDINERMRRELPDVVLI
jgi:predicted dehydrogenase